MDELLPKTLEKYSLLHGPFDYDKLSKNQKKYLKKIDFKLRNQQKWRKEEKERRKLKKLEGIKKGIVKGPSRKNLKRKPLADSKCKQRIAIDLSFINENLMAYKDVHKCVKQIHRVYSYNRRLTDPIQLHLCSVDGLTANVMSNQNGYENWQLHLNKQPYHDTFSKEEIIYLTSDSPNVIEKLDETKVYVIGGLVDHNHHKGLCYQRANERKFAHGRLPIDEYINMKTRKVLSINHVFEIMALVTEGKSWQDAFMTVIPARKAAEIRENSQGDYSSCSENEESPSCEYGPEVKTPNQVPVQENGEEES